MSETKALHIIEKYDQCVNYLYPIIQNMPRKHGQIRDVTLKLLLRIPGELYLAAKIKQISKLHIVDSSLAELRWILRFLSSKDRKLISNHQHETAMILVSEVGRMVGAQAQRLKSKKD